jgi:hypothetical protein
MTQFVTGILSTTNFVGICTFLGTLSISVAGVLCIFKKLTAIYPITFALAVLALGTIGPAIFTAFPIPVLVVIVGVLGILLLKSVAEIFIRRKRL